MGMEMATIDPKGACDIYKDMLLRQNKHRTPRMDLRTRLPAAICHSDTLASSKLGGICLCTLRGMQHDMHVRGIH